MNFKLLKLNLGSGDRADKKWRDVPSQYTAAEPGLLIILLDQSGSMKNGWGALSDKRIDRATTYVNEMIDRVVADSRAGNIREEQIFVAVFGYSRKKEGDRPDQVCRLLVDGWPAKLLQEQENALARERPLIEPYAYGETPYVTAFHTALSYIKQFLSKPDLKDRFRRSAPPVILNITDGEADEATAGNVDEGRLEDLKDVIHEIRNLETPSGFPPLVFHVQIASKDTQSVVLPSTDKSLDEHGKLLFSLASAIPSRWVQALKGRFDPPLQPGAVGLMMNAGPGDLWNFLRLASRPHARD